MTTRKLWTACGLLAALMFAANGCGESAAPPAKQVAQTDKHDDHAGHKDGDDDHGKDGKKDQRAAAKSAATKSATAKSSDAPASGDAKPADAGAKPAKPAETKAPAPSGSGDT